MRDSSQTPTTVWVVAGGGKDGVVARLPGGRPDLEVVDALARLQLAAGRRGWSVHLRDPSPELCALLELSGLAGVLGA